MSTQADLAGKRVLIVEDESLISMLLEDHLVDLGCQVIGCASRLEDAVRMARSLSFDFAILDINLAGDPTFPIAEALMERGLPYAFATGYGAAALPEKHQSSAIIQKPFVQKDLERVICAALG